MKELVLYLPGVTPTQGSTKSFPYRKKGGNRLGVKTIHQHQKQIDEFRARVKEVIEIYHDEFFVDDVNIGYIVEIFVYIERPKTVKRPMPTAKGTGDIDKLLRAVLDSLTYDEDKNPFGLYKDDSQVVKAIATKKYVTEADPVPKTKVKITRVLLQEEFAKTNEFETDQSLEDKI